jgi:hypothetical protein
MRTLPTYTSAVTVYGDFCSRTLTIREAIAFHERDDKTVTLMLGRMQAGYLGREMVTLDDLNRWVHEDDDAAAWAAIQDGERAMAEMGLLR